MEIESIVILTDHCDSFSSVCAFSEDQSQTQRQSAIEAESEAEGEPESEDEVNQTMHSQMLMHPHPIEFVPSRSRSQVHFVHPKHIMMN